MITPTDQEWYFIALTAAVLAAAGIILSALHSAIEQRISSTQKRLLNVLPGINCGQCGYPGCDAYAAALDRGEDPTLCRPGGPDTAAALAGLLGRGQVVTEDYDNDLFMPRTVAFIHQSLCNGCGKCLKACRIDAIEGARRAAHTVNPDWCIGCGECVQSCRQEAIEMIKLPVTVENFDWKISSVRINSQRGHQS